MRFRKSIYMFDIMLTYRYYHEHSCYHNQLNPILSICPAVICLPVSYYLWWDTSSETSPFFYIDYKLVIRWSVLLLFVFYYILHIIRLINFFSVIGSLTTFLECRGQGVSCVVCRPFTKLRWVVYSVWFDKPWLFTKGIYSCVTTYFPLAVSEM